MKINKPIQRWQLSYEGEWPTSVAFLGSSRRLAAGNRAGQIYVWDLPDSPPEPDEETSEAKDAQNNKGDEKPNPPDFGPYRLLEGHTNGVSHLLATTDGKTLISSSLDHSIRLWDLEVAATGSAEIVPDSITRERNTRYKSKEEKEQILNAPGVKVETDSKSQVLAGHQDWVLSLGMSHDEQRLISGDVGSLVVVWDLKERKEVARWTGHPWNWALAADLSPDGKQAVVSEYRYKRDDFDIPAAALKLWNVADSSEKLDYLKVQFPKIDPELSTYGSAQLWRKFVAGGLIAADFSTDGKMIAVGQGGETSNGQVHLLDAESGKLIRTVSGHKSGICDVKFSADGKYLLSSGRDTTLRICQVADGKEVAVLGEPRGGQFKDWLHGFAISPDQQTIAAADIAGFVHVWQLEG